MRPVAQWLFGRLAAADIECDPVYLSDYVTSKFIALSGYQISGFIKKMAPECTLTMDELLDSLCRFEKLLRTRLKEVELLKAECVVTTKQ
jgi:hypothetical protein